MKTLLKTALVGLALLGGGCTVFIPEETLYLKSVQDRATQEEVRQRLGQPHLVASTKAGDPVWVYEIYQQEPGAQNK